MNKNDLILEVSSRISNIMDGDTTLLIEQTIPTSINRVTKKIAELKPKGHERLLTEQTLSGGSVSTPTGIDYPRIDLTALTNSIVIEGKFHAVNLLTTTGSVNWRGYPVEAMPVLGLASVHNRFCYFVEYPYLYLGYTSGITDVTSIKITHYTFMNITDFPVELKDYLVDDLLMILQAEAQKKAIEDAKK